MVICASVLSVVAAAVVGAPAAVARDRAAGGGTVVGHGYQRYNPVTLSMNADGAAFVTWLPAGLYAIPHFASKSATGKWTSSQPMYSPSSYVDSAVVQDSGRLVAIYADNGTEAFTGTYRITGTAGKRHWTRERRIYRDEADATSVSATGYAAVFETNYPIRDVVLLDRNGDRRARVRVGTGNPNNTTLGSVVQNDDGSAIASWDAQVAAHPACYATKVTSLNARGRVGVPATLQRRCGVYLPSTLTPSSSGHGAMVSWPIPKTAARPRRFGVAVRDSGHWTGHVLPSMGGRAGLIAPAMSGAQVSVWWTVSNSKGTSIYLQQHRPGRWNKPVLVRRYPAGVQISNLVSALHGRRHIVAWTALPDGYSGRHISQLRFTLGDRVRAVALGAGETVLAAAAKGHRLGLLSSRRLPGKKPAQIVVRLR
jgi:hypothetical protein